MRTSLRRVPLVVLIAAATVVGGNAATAASGQASPNFAPSIAAATAQGADSDSADRRAEARPVRLPAHARHARPPARPSRPRKAHGTAAAKAAARAQLRATKAAQDAVVADLPSGTTVLYRAHAAANAVAVYTDVRNFGALNGIRGVSAVYPIAPKRPDLSYSVPLQRAPQGWQAYGDLGAHVRIAVIDSGVDYTHANFGGPGTVAAYQTALANDRKPVQPGSYDPAKFDPTSGADGTPAGMYDFAGDAYDPR